VDHVVEPAVAPPPCTQGPAQANSWSIAKGQHMIYKVVERLKFQGKQTSINALGVKYGWQ
jgi:hypothetical protein